VFKKVTELVMDFAAST